MKGYRVADPPPVDPVVARVEAILADAELDREESKSSRVEELEELYQECGWESVRNCLMSVLEDPARSAEDWTTVANFFWGAVLDHLPVNTDRLVALLYTRLPPDDGSSESNLAWSITSKLKGKSYMSRYAPLEDPGVLRELENVAASYCATSSGTVGRPDPQLDGARMSQK